MTEANDGQKNIKPELTFTERSLRRGCFVVLSVATLGLIQEFGNIVNDFATKGQAGVSVEAVHKAVFFSIIAASQFSAIKRLG